LHFYKWREPNDTYGNPTIDLSLKTKEGDGIEPIDSLQQMFDALNACAPLAVVNPKNKKHISVYPNPSHDFIQIRYDLEDNKDVYFVVKDVFGSTKGKHLLTSKNQRIDIRHISSGIYSYQLMTRNGLLYGGKFIKE
jgi:hypothetical protein